MGRKYLHAVLVGAGATVVAFLLWTAGFLDLWELATWRWRVDFFAQPTAATQKIKLILVDQNSLVWGERQNGWSWPWPREVYAPIIDFCTRSGARAIVFDLLFTEPSLYGVEDDRALAAAIDRAPLFVAPLFLGWTSGRTNTWPTEIRQNRRLSIEGLTGWLARGAPKGVVMPRATFPVEEVARSSAILASVTQDPDFDGIFRRCRLFQLFDGRVVPALSLAAFIAGEPSGKSAADSKGGASASSELSSSDPAEGVQDLAIRKGCLQIAGRCMPVDDAGRAIIHYRGSVGTYQTVSAAAVIQSELRLRKGERPAIDGEALFKDCYVFLGTSAAGLLDLRPTPVSEVYPGVELHATILDNLIAGDFLREAPRWLSVLTTLSLAMLSSVLVVRWTKVWQSALAFWALLPVPGLVGLLAYPMGTWWPIVFHETAVGLSLTGSLFLDYLYEWRQKAFIKRAFRHYLSPAVIDRMLEDPSKLELGGERRELTILFMDLKGFTSISERLDPQRLTSLLNDYLSHMTDIIFEEGGTLDKYVGDAIIAFWNAPLEQPDHALRACRAAVRCRLKLEVLRQEYLKITGTRLYARTGISTGQVIVGNMGSKKRFDYTVLGDTVNLASRLEKANKIFGTFIMVSETTWSQTNDEFLGREIGVVRVAGRKAPVRVFELIGFVEDSSDREMEAYHTALELYYTRRWQEAFDLFIRIPNDPVAKIYAKRCQSLLLDPRIPWDGVWTLTEK